MNPKHSWTFFRAGGFDQVRLLSGRDLMVLDELDQKLWVALACPTTNLEFDSKTLALIDTDKDGRIRVPELIAATKWAGALLKNPDDLLKSAPELPLSSINDATPEGQTIVASARRILDTLKKSGDSISLEDATQVELKFVETVFNGDGIIVEESASDDATRAVIRDIIGCLGSEKDRSGKPGIGQAKADQFFAEAQAYSDWWKKAESDKALLSLGEATLAAAATVKAVKAKVDDYFTRCRLAAFDPRALGALNREEKEYLLVTAKDLSDSAAEMGGFPLARVEAGRALPLKEGVNPAWASALAKLNAEVLKPLLGDKSSLTEGEWAGILARFAPFDAWSAGKAGGTVEKLGLARAREILAGPAKDKVTALIAQDKKLEPEFAAISSVEKLIRYHRDLFQLCNNFVSFRDFYGRKEKAIFQAGTLYLDQRSCDLCLSVEDGGRHALMAGMAGTYLAYCDCVRKATGEKKLIVAAFTAGDSDNLMVGRNGLFYDRKGLDWDATITKIVDNPISIRQAFWSPYKKLVRMIEENIAKRAAAADAASSDRLSQAATSVAKSDQPAPAKPAEPKKLDVGVVAALGVAVGAIGGALATLATGLLKLAPWQIPLVFVGIILLISAPAMLIAWLKLRKRNLGPILDANGWAVNAKARINVPFGGSLTQVASLPPGSHRDLVDPFAEKKSPWPKIIVFVIVLVCAYCVLEKMGYIYDWTNGRLGNPRPVKVEMPVKAEAPATVTPPATVTAPAKTVEAPK